MASGRAGTAVVANFQIHNSFFRKDEGKYVTDLQKRNLEHTAAELKAVVVHAAETQRKHVEAVTSHEFAAKRRAEALQHHEDAERKVRVARDRFRAACDALIPDEACLTTTIHIGGILPAGYVFRS